jgi:ribosomal protein L11 methylase PrmA
MARMTTSGVVPGSFRDPSGFLFRRDGLLYRQINTAYRTDYDRLLNSGLYQSLVDAGLLVPHQEVEIEPVEPAGFYKVIQPEQVPFISYPYEWCFSQLKDAALATLEIQKRALEFDMSLKDCSAYNIQFLRGKAVLIDTLSLEAYREGEPWIAYRQFCQHFLAPLALMSYRDVRLNQLCRVYIDGIPLDLASSLLPVRTRFNFALLTHIHVHARSQKLFADKSVATTDHKVSRLAFRGLVDNLTRAIKRLVWQPRGTEWVGYVEDTNYSPESLRHKETIVTAFLDKIDAQVVWDLGANTGLFSRVSASKGMWTISADVDPGCVEVNYLRCTQEGESKIIPLLLDLTNPSPAAGWGNQERMSLVERGPADAVLALALLHHLAISNNLPFDRIADFFSRICHWLIIEFVPKSDSQVQRLLLTREDIFADYTEHAFERAFARHFTVRESIQIQDSERRLYLMERERE